MNELLMHFGGFKGRPVSEEISIDFRSSSADEIRSLPFFYSDSFFSHSACSYDRGLALMSLGLTMSAVSYHDHGSTHVTDSLSRMGFDRSSIEAVKFDDSLSTDDSCAYALAAKKLSDGSWLVPLVIRSHRYGGEWASNAHISDPCCPHYAAGFKAAADGLFTSLKGYIARRGISLSDAKIWITGYSRGGAVANLLGAELSRSFISAENVFVYTFATPCTVCDCAWEYCGNIFNIVSELDIIPRVPLSKWGFRRFGTDLYLPCAARRGEDEFTRLLADMIPHFDEIMRITGCGGTRYEVCDGQELVIDLLIDYLDDLLDTSEKYADDGYQAVLMEFMGTKMNGGEFELNHFFRFLLNDSEELAGSLCELMDSWETLTRGERGRRISSLAASVATQKATRKSPAMEIMSMGTNILIHYAAKITAAKVTGRDRDYYYEQLTKLIVDVYHMGTASPLLKQHWPETYLAWLKSADEKRLFRTDSYLRSSIK